MKARPRQNLISKLSGIKKELEILARPEAKAAVLKDLDDLIATLNRLRTELTNPSLEHEMAEIYRPLEQVTDFLEFAKSNEVLTLLLSSVLKAKSSKLKRPPVEIPSNLTNEQIRALLEKDLSKDELKAVAAQRGISVGKSNNDEIKRVILKNLDRQEGYGRLAAS